MTEGGRYAARGEESSTQVHLCVWSTGREAQEPRYVLALQCQYTEMSSHSVIYPAAGSVRLYPCPPTLPLPEDPQHGYTLSTCRKTQAHGLSTTTAEKKTVYIIRLATNS